MQNSRSTLLRRLFLKDNGLKFLSLLLALISWYAVRSAIGVTKTVHDIPISVRARDGLAVVSQSRESATAVFQGSQEDIAQLEEAQARAQIQAVVYAKSRVPTAREVVAVHPRNIEGAKGARAVKINRPADVAVEIDRDGQKNIMVRPVLAGMPDAGQVTSVACAPPSVRVQGAVGKLADLKTLGTEPVDVSRATESFDKTVHVVAPGSRGLLRIEPADVTVSVIIERSPATRRLTDVSVTAMVRPAAGVAVEVRPAKVDVVLTGNSLAIEKMMNDDVKVLVECFGLEPSAPHNLPLTVQVPHGIDVTAVADPATVQVLIQTRR